MRRVFVLLPVFSALWLASSVLIAGAFRPGYNHATQFISELAAAGTSGAAAMNFAGFLPAEFLIILFAGLGFFRFRESMFARVGFVLIALYAALLSFAAFFPCDVGCRPEDPSTDHLIHILAGLLAYLLGIASLVVTALDCGRAGAGRLRLTGFILAALGVATVTQITLDTDLVGLYQCGLEVILYTWFILYGAHLSRRLAGVSDGGGAG